MVTGIVIGKGKEPIEAVEVIGTVILEVIAETDTKVEMTSTAITARHPDVNVMIKSILRETIETDDDTTTIREVDTAADDMNLRLPEA